MPNMNVWEIVLFAAVAYVAVMALVRQMLRYRQQLEEVLTKQLRANLAAKRTARAAETDSDELGAAA